MPSPRGGGLTTEKKKKDQKATGVNGIQKRNEENSPAQRVLEKVSLKPTMTEVPGEKPRGKEGEALSIHLSKNNKTTGGEYSQGKVSKSQKTSGTRQRN